MKGLWLLLLITLFSLAGAATSTKGIKGESESDDATSGSSKGDKSGKTGTKAPTPTKSLTTASTSSDSSKSGESSKTDISHAPTKSPAKGDNDSDESYSNSSSSKGKGKGKGMRNSQKSKSSSKSGRGGACPKPKKKKGSKRSDGVITEIDCKDYTFLDMEYDSNGSSKSSRRGYGKGKGKGGDTSARKRQLGYSLKEGCSPNPLEVASSNGNLTMFVELIESAGLEDIFNCTGPFTVLAPSNDAFESLAANVSAYLEQADEATIQQLLLYHILPGTYISSDLKPGCVETLMGDYVEVSVDPILFDDAVGVSVPDVSACNGVIHIADQVLIPPSFGRFWRYVAYLYHIHYFVTSIHSLTFHSFADVPTVPEICEALDFREGRLLQAEGELCETNILETARLDPEFSSFVSLVQEAGLSEIFLCAGPFTALIPTNAAFTALDVNLSPNQLVDTLLYHIVEGLEFSTNLTAGPLDTLQGSSVTADVDPVTFNEVGVVEADILACNGVIHKIEAVLLPPDLPENPVPTPGPTSQPIPAPAAEELSQDNPPVTPTVAAPTPSTETQPSDESIRIRVADYYMSYVVPALESAPTEEETQELLAVTRDFWFQYFQMEYQNSNIKFKDISLKIEESLYNAGIPDPDFNFYIDFDTEIIYEKDSAEPAGAMETFRLMADADFVVYILEYIRTLERFKSTNEIDFRAIEQSLPAAARSSTESTEKSESVGSYSVPVISVASVIVSLSAVAALVLLKRRNTRKRYDTGDEPYDENSSPSDIDSIYSN